MSEAPKLQWKSICIDPVQWKVSANAFRRHGDCASMQYGITASLKSETAVFRIGYSTSLGLLDGEAYRVDREGFPTLDAAKAWCQAREDEAWRKAHPPAPEPIVSLVDESPRYDHTSSCCTFLGRHDEFDLYYCPQVGMPTVIARYGEGGDYNSGMVFAFQEPLISPLVEARKRAEARGLDCQPERYRPAVDDPSPMSLAEIEEARKTHKLRIAGLLNEPWKVWTWEPYPLPSTVDVEDESLEQAVRKAIRKIDERATR